MSEPPVDNLTFEQALGRLEDIVRDLEDGQSGLEESLGRYEQGVRLIKHCHRTLASAEQRILKLTGVDADGEPVVEPFEHAATVEVTKIEAKRRRKKADDPDNLFGPARP